MLGDICTPKTLINRFCFILGLLGITFWDDGEEMKQSRSKCKARQCKYTRQIHIFSFFLFFFFFKMADAARGVPPPRRKRKWRRLEMKTKNLRRELRNRVRAANAVLQADLEWYWHALKELIWH